MEFHDFWWFLWFLRFPWFSGARGGPRGGPKGGPRNAPPPILGAIFRKNDQKTIGFLRKSEKGEIPAWGPWIRLFIFPYKRNGILVILIKLRSAILLSYNNRGPPAGPGRGPVRGPSRGFRFSRFSQNFCIFWNFQEFLWISGISWKFQFFLETGASLAAHAKTLIFLREYWWFWGALHCKINVFSENHEIHEIHRFSWKL